MNLEQRFIELWERIGAEDNAKEEFNRLVNLYSEPGRNYHDLRHIEDCLDRLDEVKDFVENPDQLEIAIWYHDAIYDTHARDNEDESAAFVYEICKNSGTSLDFARNVSDLILLTTHNAMPENEDGKILMDIDLSILGKSPEEFDEYEEKIRQEYFWVPEKDFNEVRAEEVLQRFLDRDSIYLTDFFREKYQTQARSNIERSLEKLRK